VLSPSFRLSSRCQRCRAPLHRGANEFAERHRILARRWPRLGECPCPVALTFSLATSDGLGGRRYLRFASFSSPWFFMRGNGGFAFGLLFTSIGSILSILFLTALSRGPGGSGNHRHTPALPVRLLSRLLVSRVLRCPSSSGGGKAARPKDVLLGNQWAYRAGSSDPGDGVLYARRTVVRGVAGAYPAYGVEGPAQSTIPAGPFARVRWANGQLYIDSLIAVTAAQPCAAPQRLSGSGSRAAFS